MAMNWMSFVSKVLHEENVGYSLDDQCGVHYFIDEDFERSRMSTLKVLESSRYSGVKAAFDDAFRHMDSDPQDTKASIRSIFEALEILVKLMVETKNLNKYVVENSLKNKCLVLFNEDPVSKKVVNCFFNTIAQFVDALHNYRHGQAIDEPVSPSEQLTIFIISTVSSYIRWIAQMDTCLNAK
jgi:hypothetical protein